MTYIAKPDPETWSRIEAVAERLVRDYWHEDHTALSAAMLRVVCALWAAHGVTQEQAKRVALGTINAFLHEHSQ